MSESTNQVNRRDLLQMAAVLASMSAASATLGSSPVAAASGGKPNKVLADSAAKCALIGEECANHCIDMLGNGKKEMAACLVAVRETIAACNALVVLATAGSARLKSFAAVVGDICADCAKACEPHMKMAICKACYDACKECEKACRAA